MNWARTQRCAYILKRMLPSETRYENNTYRQDSSYKLKIHSIPINMICLSRYTNTPKYRRNTFGRLAVGGKERERGQEVKQERALHRTIRRAGREWRTPVSGLASSLVLSCSRAYLLEGRKGSQGQRSLSVLNSHETHPGCRAGKGWAHPHGLAPSTCSLGDSGDGRWRQARVWAPGGAATGLTHGLYPDHPPLMRPQKPLLKMALHPAPCWAERGSKRASCPCSLPLSPCSGAMTELVDVREATTAQQTNMGPGQLCPGRQLWLSPPLSRPQQAQVSQLPPTLGAASLSKSPGGTSMMWLESPTPRGSRLLEKHGGWGWAEGQNNTFLDLHYTSIRSLKYAAQSRSASFNHGF